MRLLPLRIENRECCILDNVVQRIRIERVQKMESTDVESVQGKKETWYRYVGGK